MSKAMTTNHRGRSIDNKLFLEALCNSGDTILIYAALFRLGPGFPRWSVRPSFPSTAATNGSRPKGLPLRSWRRSAVTSSSAAPVARKSVQLPTNASSGTTVMSASSSPATWAAALLQGYSQGVPASPAPTGFCSMYRAAASKYGSSKG